MSWSPQQEAALKAVKAWLKDKRGPQVFKLFGYAGTGKTTLAREFASTVKGSVLFGAFTGKAALVLRNKGCADASTIHSMIYTPVEEHSAFEPTFVINTNSAVDGAALVVIDECSMVDEQLGKDLLSVGTKVLVLGDPEQLPPVKGQGYFTSGEPDMLLTEVHRQAQDNPIIAMSMKVRAGEELAYGDYGESRVIARKDVDQREVLNAAQILVGLNRTRHAYNRRIRDLLKRPGALPVVGDKLVCLRNDRTKSLLNGGLWAVRKASKVGPVDPDIRLEVLSDDIQNFGAKVRVLRQFFEGGEDELTWEDRKRFQEFAYGYALTVHKAQGSQWGDVYFFDENMSFLGPSGQRQFRYTAITRAAERITIVR